MRKELKELRKQHAEHKPVSKLRKADISAQLERLRGMRETTAPVASTPGAEPKKMMPKARSVKESKEEEHPVAPHHGTTKGEPRKTARKAFEGETPKKAKAAMMAKMMKMMAEMTSDEE